MENPNSDYNYKLHANWFILKVVCITLSGIQRLFAITIVSSRFILKYFESPYHIFSAKAKYMQSQTDHL